MTTRLGRLFEHGIEAAWLAAVVVIPLLFNTYSRVSFDSFKSIFLRVIVCLLLALWAGASLTEARPTTDRRPQTAEQDVPAAVALALVLVLALLYVSSTATSILPRVSFWGSHLRFQGLLTTLAYLALCLGVRSHLKTDRQRQRLISSLILVSILVTGYGLLQRFELDPIPWSSQDVNPADRITSSVGNPIFVGGYLIMIIPLTLSRLLAPPAGYARPQRRFWYGTYGLILLLQLAALVFTQSRGPFLGLAVGLLVFLLVVSFQTRRRKLAAATLLAGGAVVLFIIVLNLPGTPLGPLADVPLMGRLARLFDPRPFMGRILIWKVAVDTLSADPARLLIGFGPDTMGAATTRFYPAELVILEGGTTADRAHNDLLQTVMSVGVPGLAVQLAFWGVLVLTGLQRLGIRVGRGRGWTLPAGWGACGVAGTLIPVFVSRTWQFSTLGLGLGLSVGLLAYLSIVALKGPAEELSTDLEHGLHGLAHTDSPNIRVIRGSESVDSQNGLLTAGLLSALAAHFTELQLGIGVTTTVATFWLLSAVLLSNLVSEGQSTALLEPVGEVKSSDRAARRASRRRLRPPRATRLKPDYWRATLAGLSTGLALAALSFGLITNQPQPVSATLGVAILLLGFIVFGGLIWSHDERLWADGGETLLRYLGTYLVVVLLTLVVYLIGHQALVRPEADITLVVYWLTLFLVAWLIAVALWMAWPAFDALPWFGSRAWVYPVLVVVTGVLVNGVGLWWLRADMYFKNGVVAHDAGRYEDSVRWFLRAIDLAPDQDIYHGYTGLDSRLAMAQQSDPTTSTRLFQQAERELQRAMALDPFNPDYPANLGHLYRIWATRLPPGPARTESLRTALAYYAQVEVLSPNNHAPRIAQDVAAAREMLQKQ
jgi:hypothetical protein